MNENRIIAVELAMTDINRQETELDMFACKHTYLDQYPSMPMRARITLHTTQGDITVRFPALANRTFEIFQ